jgi:hypothetical protein
MRNSHETKTRNNDNRNFDYIDARFGRFARFGSGTIETIISPEESG